MNGQVYECTPDQVRHYFPNPQEWDWIDASRPLMIGLYGGEVQCILGAIPLTIISGSAYLWCCTPERYSKMVFARWTYRVLDQLFTRYTSLGGNCFSVESAYWLHRLGADFYGNNFVLGREQWQRQRA